MQNCCNLLQVFLSVYLIAEEMLPLLVVAPPNITEHQESYHHQQLTQKGKWCNYLVSQSSTDVFLSTHNRMRVVLHLLT